MQNITDGWVDTALNGVAVLFEDGKPVRVSMPADSEREIRGLNDHLRQHYGAELVDPTFGWSEASGEPDVTAALQPVEV